MIQEYSLSELCKNLDFCLDESLDSSVSELTGLRCRFHRNLESIVNQFTVSCHYYVSVLKALVNDPLNSSSPLTTPSPSKIALKVGILLPDLFPESSETLAGMVMKSLVDQGLVTIDNLLVMTRRGPRLAKRLPPSLSSVKCDWDWSEPTLFSECDVVIVIATNTHVPLASELAATQSGYERTLFLISSPGISRIRAQNIVKSEHVIQPFLTFEAKPEDAKVDQSAVPRNMMSTISRGISVPDLDILKQVFSKLLVVSGLPQDQAVSIVKNVLPKTHIDAIEAFEEFKLPRLAYSEPIVKYKVPVDPELIKSLPSQFPTDHLIPHDT